MTHNSEEKEEKEIKKKKKQEEIKKKKETKSNLSKTPKMPEASAVQYVAKLKAKLIADRNTRMAVTKPTATKVVVKSGLVGPVRKEPPRTAGFIGL